jgi:hypothetical protein
MPQQKLLELGANTRPAELRFTAGRKHPNGTMDRSSLGRFWATEPFSSAGGASRGSVQQAGQCPLHPDYAEFNDRGPTRLRGFLAASTPAGCLVANYRANSLVGQGDRPVSGGTWSRGEGKPGCMGDGETASRYDGPGRDRVDVPCPGPDCPYVTTELSPQGRPVAEGERGSTCCKLGAGLWFMTDPEQTGRPAALAELYTNSPWSARNMAGLVCYYHDKVQELEDGWGLIGLAFQVTITWQTSPGRRFPILYLAAAGDLIEQVLSRRQKYAGLQPRTIEPVATGSQAMEVQHVARSELSPGGGPSTYELPPEVLLDEDDER